MNSHYEKFLATGVVKCIDSEIPFDIPSGWEWVRMQHVIEFINGRAYKKEELLDKGKYKVLRVGNFFTNDIWYYSDLELPEEKYCYNGDLLYAWSASFGPQIWTGDKTIFHYHIWNVKYNSIVLSRAYLYHYLLFDTTQIRKSTTGSTMIHVSMENMNPRLIPIPPMSEQHRIAQRIEELLPLIERYEQTQKDIDKLNNGIKNKLRESILQEAIQGKLVPQDPTEGTAEELLQQIKAEKVKLVKEGKLKKQALADNTIYKGADNRYWEKLGIGTVKCIDDEIPFELPDNWNWTRLDYIADIYTGNSISESEKKLKYTNVVGREYIGTKDVGFDCTICYNNGVAIPKGFENGFRIAPKFSVLMCVEGGSAGRKIAMTDRDVCFGNKLCCFAPYIDIHEYVFYYLQTPVFLEMFNAGKTGIIEGVGVNNLKKLLVPLPPLKEQHRIVTQIDRLFKELH